MSLRSAKRTRRQPARSGARRAGRDRGRRRTAITAHLREDRRHIRDADYGAAEGGNLKKPLNFEMADDTEDMLRISLATKPHAVCLVPERREELTTEGGPRRRRAAQYVYKPFIAKLNEAGVRVSFVHPLAGPAPESRWPPSCARR